MDSILPSDEVSTRPGAVHLPTAVGSTLAQVLVPLSRTALTNITQTALMVLLRQTMLRGSVSAPAALVAAIGIMLAPIPASAR